MQLEEGLDTGPVYACEAVPIGPDQTADDLRHQLVAVGTDLLVAHLTKGLGQSTPQEGEPTYAAKIDPAEHELHWDRPAAELHRLVRLGRAWTTFRGKRLRVLEATPAEAAGDPGDPGTLTGLTVATGDGGLELRRVQPEGKGPQAAADWRNGARPADGERLGAADGPPRAAQP
jgi:methionyl-tRNA formyltransferase